MDDTTNESKTSALQHGPDSPTPTTPAEGTTHRAPGLAPAGRPYSIDFADLGQEHPQYRFAHAYLYGPHALRSQDTYSFLYPNATENTARVEASRLLNHPETKKQIASLCADQRMSKEFFRHELFREATRLKTRKTRQVITQDGEIITLLQEEDRDRTPVLTLVADVLGERKAQESAGVVVNVQMGAGLDLAERPLDVTRHSLPSGQVGE